MSALTIVIDVVLALVIALLVFLGVKRGFAKSFFKTTKIFFVIIVTILIGSLVATLCQNLFVNGMFEGKISDKLVEKVNSADGEFSFETITDGVPGIVKKLVPMNEIEEYFSTLSGNKDEIARQVGTKIENVLISIVSNVIGYILAFILSFIICTVAIFIIEKCCELPVIGWLNHLGGVLWGIANAYLVSSVLVCIIALIFGAEFIDGTALTRILYKIGLFTL